MAAAPAAAASAVLFLRVSAATAASAAVLLPRLLVVHVVDLLRRAATVQGRAGDKMGLASRMMMGSLPAWNCSVEGRAELHSS